MDKSSPQSSPPAAQDSPRSRNWPLWLEIGFFSLAGIALAVSLSVVLWRELAASPEAPEPVDTLADTAPTAPPTDLREHQQLVSEVIGDLDRAVLVGDSPTRGNPDAEVVLFEFSDFQCPYCAQATTEVEAFIEQHESEVLFVYKHLPLVNIHPDALPAALAAWAAGQQGQFWAFHDALFANQEALGEDLYLDLAEDLGLDLEQFNRDRASEAAQAAIAQDLALASELQLQSTPSFILDDLLIPGAVPADFFSEALARIKAFQNDAPGGT